ncbi:hypothetical protein PYR76_09850 [Acinetobacter soli]|nr:hypothetical protein [Acinetobacter soli]WEH96799.1 hypothetical protein PYR76_09850 [Acinetobacter soli]
MAYEFEFSSVLPYTGMIAEGLGRTVVLTLIGTVFGLALGVIGGHAVLGVFNRLVPCFGFMSK